MDARRQAGQRGSGRAGRFARRLAQLSGVACLAALTLSGADARYSRGWLLLQNEHQRTITLVRRDQRHEVSYGAYPAQSRNTLFRDMTLLNDGRLAVSVTAQLPLGEQWNGVLTFDPERAGEAPETTPTDAVICHQILESGGTLWCLGPDFASLVQGTNLAFIHQVTRNGAIPVVERKHMPARGGRSPWLPSPSGEAALLTVGDGKVLAWLPNAGQIVSLTPEGMRLYDLPLDATQRRSVSVAVTESGRLYALLPLLPAGATESLTTPYGIFELNRLGGDQWTRVKGTPPLRRGTRLLAVEGGEAVLLDRTRQVRRVRVR